VNAGKSRALSRLGSAFSSVAAQKLVYKVHPMGDCEAVIGLDGRKEERYKDGGKEGSRTKERRKDGRREESGRNNTDKTGLSLDQLSVGSFPSPPPSKAGIQLEVKLPWYKGITLKDIRDILPTLLILVIGLVIMILVIPYAFSSVFKQLAQEREMNRVREEAALNRSRLLEELL